MVRDNFISVLSIIVELSAEGITTSTNLSNNDYAKHRPCKNENSINKEKNSSQQTDAPMARHAIDVTKRISNELDVDDKQREQINALVVAFAQNIRRIHSSSQKNDHDTKQLALEDTINCNKIEKLHNENFVQIKQVSNKITQVMVEVAKILSAERPCPSTVEIDKFAKNNSILTSGMV